MEVALLNPTFWPEVRRGSERVARSLADGLADRGHRVRLVTSHRGPTRRTVEDRLVVTRLRRPPEGRLRRRRFEDHLAHVPLSYLELRRDPPDVAHALYPTDAVAAARWSRDTGRPSVLAYMGIPTRGYLVSRRWRVEALQRALAGCGAVTVLSEAAAAAFRRVVGVDPRVVPPPVDLDAFSPGGERAPDPTIVCAADVREPRKRVGLLLEAFARVRRERPTARLVLSRPVAGPGPDGEGVELADLDDTGRLADAYRRAWVSVLPSVGEAYGLVLAEALACGTPGVGTDAGGIPEVLDSDEVGRLFSGDDPDALARALLEALELADDPATAPACRARVQELSVARCAERHEALYRELLDG